jgi:hypothetical protein
MAVPKQQASVGGKRRAVVLGLLCTVIGAVGASLASSQASLRSLSACLAGGAGGSGGDGSSSAGTLDTAAAPEPLLPLGPGPGGHDLREARSAAAAAAAPDRPGRVRALGAPHGIPRILHRIYMADPQDQKRWDLPARPCFLPLHAASSAPCSALDAGGCLQRCRAAQAWPPCPASGAPPAAVLDGKDCSWSVPRPPSRAAPTSHTPLRTNTGSNPALTCTAAGRAGEAPRLGLAGLRCLAEAPACSPHSQPRPRTPWPPLHPPGCAGA